MSRELLTTLIITSPTEIVIIFFANKYGTLKEAMVTFWPDLFCLKNRQILV